jgi:ubiquinone/menaquinone biosynthesis C-methylase UbiE
LGLAAVFVKLTDFSSALRQTLWRWVYNAISRRDKSGKFVFMNYGYADKNAKQTLELKPEDDGYIYYIQIYNYVVQDLELENKNIMEVGCGRGGGGSFLLRYKNPKLYTGIDLSELAISWCNKNYNFKNSNWLQGVADKLPVSDSSMDVVINIESSHCYPAMDKFLSEVNRVLKLNGYFAFCDLRKSSEVEELNTAMMNSGLNIIKQHEITSEVLNGLSQVSQLRDEQITSVFPKLFRRAIRDFAAVKDTTVYKMLETGQMKYCFYLLQKSSECWD